MRKAKTDENEQNCPKILDNCPIFNPKPPLESSEPQHFCHLIRSDLASVRLLGTIRYSLHVGTCAYFLVFTVIEFDQAFNMNLSPFFRRMGPMGPMGPMMGGPMGPMRPPMGYPGGGGGMNNSGPNSSNGPPSGPQSGPSRPLFPAASQAASMKVCYIPQV